MGVDHNEFILMRYNNYGHHARHEYRKIYRIDIVVNDDEVKMDLYEIDRPYDEGVVRE